MIRDTRLVFTPTVHKTELEAHVRLVARGSGPVPPYVRCTLGTLQAEVTLRQAQDRECCFSFSPGIRLVSGVVPAVL